MTVAKWEHLPVLDTEPLDNKLALAADHARRYAATEGRAEDHTPDGAPVLLLTTVGRRSGKARRNPLAFGRRGDDYVLVASNGGADTSSSWFHNLVAEPQVLIQVLGERLYATARVTEGVERAELFALMLDVLPALHGYLAATDREIPIVVVTPWAPRS